METLLRTLVDQRLTSRIWARQTAVFAAPGAPQSVHDAIGSRLGWLDAPRDMGGRLDEVAAFAQAVTRAGCTHTCLLGMGGSSLCADVLRELRTAGPQSLVVLDSTDERTITQITDALDPARTVFLVSSKSGSTIEVSSLERHFWGVASKALGADAGGHFAAITDPDTPLVTLAAERGYRHVFLNPADIGGRYSALSLFGLVPAALIGLNVRHILDAGAEMADACRADDPANPGLRLGAFMAAHAMTGRDKLTLLMPPPIEVLGLWIEQLVAESTGKDGRGILPVVCEPAGSPAEYGHDRMFVACLTPKAAALAARADGLERAGHPVFRIDVTPDGLGGEFFRWEFATAVAGAMIGVNPFDEPNVKDAKARTQALLESRRATGQLRIEPPFAERDGILVRHSTNKDATLESDGRFIALLDYLPTDRHRMATVERIRQRLRHSTGAATTYGVGPRYLHSTGQYHKGGANRGLFVLATAADETVTAVPGTDYSFSVLKHAQALGDFEALVAAGRRVIHIHLPNAAADHSAELERALKVTGLAG